ncbi:hypothetical protein [Herbidospora daliensis]|nr:hypothetical protein [Herbidospora daliensis]
MKLLEPVEAAFDDAAAALIRRIGKRERTARRPLAKGPEQLSRVLRRNRA